MTNDETRMTKQEPGGARLWQVWPLLRHSSFEFRHCLVIRDFVIRNCLVSLFALGLSLVGYQVTGATLDLFVGGIFIAALITPPLAAVSSQSAIGICLGIAGTWWLAVHRYAISIGQWSMCLGVLISFTLVLTTTVRLLIRLKLPAVVASAIITLLSLAWLTWPIWLSSTLAGAQLHWSVIFQPILVINHIISNLGIWTEQQVAYGLTNLGQDVQYQLPSSAWPIIAMQSGLSILASLPKRQQQSA